MLPDPLIRFLLDDRSALLRNCPGHTTAVLQLLVRCIDNDIHLFAGDVTLNELEALIRGKSLLDKDSIHKKTTA
jgi:hypothetical protein